VVAAALTAPTGPDEDGSADTQMFRAFVEREDSVPVKPSGAPFRMIIIVIGLIVAVGVVLALLKL
jgi:hypothetical protein